LSLLSRDNTIKGSYDVCYFVLQQLKHTRLFFSLLLIEWP
jgi:hypothetical protein